jgi:hypothetical protein
MLNVTFFYCYCECRYAKRNSAECRGPFPEPAAPRRSNPSQLNQQRRRGLKFKLLRLEEIYFPPKFFEGGGASGAPPTLAALSNSSLSLTLSHTRHTLKKSSLIFTLSPTFYLYVPSHTLSLAFSPSTNTLSHSLFFS